MADRYADRRKKLLQAGRDLADGLLISNVTNVTWLTGFTGDATCLLLTKSRAILITDSRYDTQIDEECPGVEKHIRDRVTSLLKACGEVAAESKVRRLGFEGGSLTFSDHKTLAEHSGGIECVPTTGLVEDLRAIKDASEIGEIRHAARIAERGFAVLRATLQLDQTEREVAHNLEHAMRGFGGKGGSFPIIVAVGPRGALPHARPGDVRISEADFTLVDWGCEGPNGYRSDLTRMVVTGKVSPKFEKLYNLVLKAQLEGIAAVKPGARACDVDAAARKIIEDAGYGPNFGHGLGHGIGLDIHEMPRLRDGLETPLKPGMIVTVEPGVYLPGWGGIRIEDDVLVTKTGHEVLTSVPKRLEDAVLRSE